MFLFVHFFRIRNRAKIERHIFCPKGIGLIDYKKKTRLLEGDRFVRNIKKTVSSH